MSHDTRHMRWLADTGERLETGDGRSIEIWRLEPGGEEDILAEWATHFRNHYCLDTEIDLLRDGPGLSRRDYLVELVFPSASVGLGPSVRAGDFAEILVADYLQYMIGYWVPRWRYELKVARNESTKGADILGFRVVNRDAVSPEDELILCEVKAKLTGRDAERSKLQEAIDHSARDYLVRKAESLNALFQRLSMRGATPEANLVRRFQNKVLRPYREVSAAAVLIDDIAFDGATMQAAVCVEHPNRDALVLLVITGQGLMALVHAMYERAADDA